MSRINFYYNKKSFDIYFILFYYFKKGEKMIRIWAKILKEEKILKDVIFEKFCNFEIDNFYDYLAEICHKLDISTPVVLSKHIFHYINFNTTVFYPQDFPEEVSFDKLVIEEASNY